MCCTSYQYKIVISILRKVLIGSDINDTHSSTKQIRKLLLLWRYSLHLKNRTQSTLQEKLEQYLSKCYILNKFLEWNWKNKNIPLTHTRTLTITHTNTKIEYQRYPTATMVEITTSSLSHFNDYSELQSQYSLRLL